MNGAIGRTCGLVGWLLLAACAGGCVQAMSRSDETELLNLSGLLEPAPVRADLLRSDQPSAGPVFDGEGNLASVADLGDVADVGDACPIAANQPPRGPFVGVRVLLSRLVSPLRCIGSGRCGSARGCGGGCSDGGGAASSSADNYHHSQFHPIPTRPVFDPRTPPFLAMDDQIGPYGSPEPGPVAPLPNRKPIKAAPPEAHPSSDTHSPPTRLEILPTPPSAGVSDSGDRTVLSSPPSQSIRGSDPSSSWVFYPPVLRDPEPARTAAQARRTVRLETKSGRVARY